MVSVTFFLAPIGVPMHRANRSQQQAVYTRFAAKKVAAAPKPPKLETWSPGSSLTHHAYNPVTPDDSDPGGIPWRVFFQEGIEFQKQGKVADAEMQYNRAIGAYTHCYGKGQPSLDMARLHYNRGVLLLRLSQDKTRASNVCKKAWDDFKIATPIFEQHADKLPPEVLGDVYNAMAQVCARRENPEDNRLPGYKGWMKKAQDAYAQANIPLDQWVRFYWNIGNALENNPNLLNEAPAVLDMAVDYGRLMPPAHQVRYRYLDKVYDDLSDAYDAIKQYTKQEEILLHHLAYLDIISQAHPPSGEASLVECAKRIRIQLDLGYSAVQQNQPERAAKYYQEGTAQLEAMLQLDKGGIPQVYAGPTLQKLVDRAKKKDKYPGAPKALKLLTEVCQNHEFNRCLTILENMNS